MKLQRLDQSSSYRSFMNQRDAALEKILQTNQLRITEITQQAFGLALMMMVHEYPKMLAKRGWGHIATDQDAQLSQRLDQILKSGANQVFHQVTRLRRNAYILSNVAQAEAIGRATGKHTHYKIDRQKILTMSNGPLKGGLNLREAFSAAFVKVKHDLLEALHKSLMTEEDPEQAKVRFYKALPKRKYFSVMPDALKRVPKPMKESRDDEPKITMTQGFVTDEDWDDLVEDYKSEYVPDIRGPEDIVSEATTKAEKNMYAWELERDVSQAFVEDVRQGQVDAARINGIIDFVWIAVIDDRTGEFDAWADGRLTSEIKDAIENGDAPESEYQTEVPPAHFNCRCTLAPATEDLGEQIPESNAEDFESWLNS